MAAGFISKCADCGALPAPFQVTSEDGKKLQLCQTCHKNRQAEKSE